MNTQNHVPVRELNPFERTADLVVLPLKWCVNCLDIIISRARYGPMVRYGTTRLTNPWNNTRLQKEDVAHLDHIDMVHFEGDPTVNSNTYPFFRFLNGSWKQYQVIEPVEVCTWHVGWISGDIVDLSRIKLTGKVKALIGPRDISFFGVYAGSGLQAPVVNTGSGNRIAESEFANIPQI